MYNNFVIIWNKELLKGCNTLKLQLLAGTFISIFEIILD